MRRFIKPAIFIIIIIIVSQRYSVFQFDDVRNVSLAYFAYGLQRNPDINYMLKWFIPVCLLFSYIFECHKSSCSTNKLNKMLRYPGRTKYFMEVLVKTVIKSLLCWTLILMLTDCFKGMHQDLSFLASDTLVIVNSYLVITALSLLYLVLDMMMNSLTAFIALNSAIVFSIMINNISNIAIFKILAFPNMLMAIQYNQSELISGIIFVTVIIIILTVIYIRKIKQIDII